MDQSLSNIISGLAKTNNAVEMLTTHAKQLRPVRPLQRKPSATAVSLSRGKYS